MESNSINYKEYLNGTQFKNYTYEIVNLTFDSNYIFQSEEFEINKYLNIENRSLLIEAILTDLFIGINLTEIDNKIDKKITNENIEFIFTSTSNQKNNEEKNKITMNLGECENILKNEYNISINDSLYILQVINTEIGMKIPKMEYEV